MKRKVDMNTLALGNLRHRRRQYAVMITGIIFAMVLSTSIPLLFFSASETVQKQNLENYGAQDVIVCAEGHMLQISIRIFEGTARFPLEDVENYFYLPAEDKVIHKDVAQFVDRQYRKKATKKNCFLKKEGSFLPQNHPYFQPAYMVEGDKKRSYFELSQIADAEQELLTEYALDIINS